MKEELQTKLVEILGSMQNAASRAGDFAMAQLPDIAQSYVVYGRVRAVAASIFCLLVASALFALARWAYKNPWNDSIWSSDEGKKRCDGNRCVIFIPSFVGAVFVVIAFASFDWLVWFAPKVWLLKEIAGLVR